MTLKDERNGALDRAARLLASRSLSRAELTKRLCEKGESEEDAESAADYMETLGALDDHAYAGMIVRHYSARGYGETRLREELRRRGVPRDFWDEAIEEAPAAEETIAHVIEARTGGKALDEKGRKKLSSLLLRRGFAWDDVRTALRALESEEKA